MSQEKSFIGEFSLGLSIAPIIKSSLHSKYKTVIPINPWQTREGSNISKSIHKEDHFRIFGIYPRRPKLNTQNQCIEFKINDQIIKGASEALKVGLPIIAVCPLVRNFWELNSDLNIIFVKINSEMEEFRIQIVEKEIISSYPKSIIYNNEILDYIDEFGKEFSIVESLQAFKRINQISMRLDYHPRFGLGYIYKPIYFLIK